MYGIVTVKGIPGLLTMAELIKLEGIEEGANKTIVDTALSETSANPVQNCVVSEALAKKVDGDGLEFSVVNGILTVTYDEEEGG